MNVLVVSLSDVLGSVVLATELAWIHDTWYLHLWRFTNTVSFELMLLQYLLTCIIEITKLTLKQNLLFVSFPDMTVELSLGVKCFATSRAGRRRFSTMINLVFSEMPLSFTSIITLVTIVGDISMHLVHVIFKVLFELCLVATYFT